MNTIYIIHGCPSKEEKDMDANQRTYDKHWIPWIKEQLSVIGEDVEIPLMPNPWEPKYEAYKKVFEKLPISETSILIGHSCGAAFLVRWLGESKQKVDKLILVAPWKIAKEDNEIKKAFYEYKIDETIKLRVNTITIFTSDDEEDDGKKSVRIFHDALGGRIINLPKHGHYTLEDMRTSAFPELLNEITA